MWLSVDPLAGYNPIFEVEHYIDGQHNGGIYNAMNLNVYGYTYQNPIKYIDPNGKQNEVTNPSGQKIVENYINSNNKYPGGLCYGVAKERFETAFRQVMGSSYLNFINQNSGNQYNTPKKAYERLFASMYGKYLAWTSLPMDYKATGGAGAIANAGFGELKTTKQIWSGELTPGAVLQVWPTQDDYNKVRDGEQYNSYGHSFIFLSYDKDENGNILGMNVADQGYFRYSDNYVTQNEFEVWFGANITTKPRPKVEAIEIKTSGVKLPE